VLEVVAELERRAHEYELRAASCEERGPLDGDVGAAAAGFTVVAIVLREVAEAIAEEAA
jgi:hypothetical protein